MKSFKIFTIGGATFDIFVKPADQAVMELVKPEEREKWLCLKYGGKVAIDDVIETFGGGATNTSIAFSRLGFDAYCVSKIGAEYGEKVLNNLKNAGVHSNYISKTRRDKTGFSTIINALDGDRTVLGYAGANRFFTAKDLPLKALSGADFIFLNHIAEQSDSVLNTLAKFLDRHPHIPLAWNPGHEQLTAGVRKWKKLLKHVRILFLNKEEAALFSKKPYQLAGVKHEDPRFHVHAPKSFLPPYADDVTEIMLEFFKYGVRNVVITDGRNGAQASDGERLYFCPVVSTKRVDSLGAGDAFASGFTGCFIRFNDLKSCLISGTFNANSVVSYFGAQQGLLTEKQMQQKLKEKKLHVSSAKIN